MSVSVVVPATDAPATLARCVAAIGASQLRPDELIVVEDAGLATPAAARNEGALRARGDVLVFVDADVLVRPDAIGRLVERVVGDSGITAAFGSYDDSPGAAGTVSAYRFLLHHSVHAAGAGPADTFWAGLGAVRREAFLEVGGFDAGRRWLEDVDLGLRLRAAGREIRLDPRAQGKHLKRLTLLEMLRSDALHRAAPWTDLLLRRRSSSAALNLGSRHRLSALAALIGGAALAARRPLAAFAALAALALLNRSLLTTIARSRGRAAALLAVPLHAMHHLAGIAGAACGLAGWLRAGRPRGSQGSVAPADVSPPR